MSSIRLASKDLSQGVSKKVEEAISVFGKPNSNTHFSSGYTGMYAYSLYYPKFEITISPYFNKSSSGNFKLAFKYNLKSYDKRISNYFECIGESDVDFTQIKEVIDVITQGEVGVWNE